MKELVVGLNLGRQKWVSVRAGQIGFALRSHSVIMFRALCSRSPAKHGDFMLYTGETKEREKNKSSGCKSTPPVFLKQYWWMCYSHTSAFFCWRLHTKDYTRSSSRVHN